MLILQPIISSRLCKFYSVAVKLLCSFVHFLLTLSCVVCNIVLVFLTISFIFHLLFSGLCHCVLYVDE